MGLGLMLSFSLVSNLIHHTLKPKKSLPLVIGGLIGSLLVIIGGNTHTLWYFIKNHNWKGYWYADATRFIENTIHEFPSYSFVVSDLHAHVWGLPFVLTFLIFILVWTIHLFPAKNKKTKTKTTKNYLNKYLKLLKKSFLKPPPHLLSAILLGILLGTFIMTSAWDFLIYSIFLIILGFLLVVSFPRSFFRLLSSAIVMIITAILIALPWYINFTSISEGIAFVTLRSPIWQLFALWTNHVVYTIFAIILVIFISTKIKKNLRSSRLTYHRCHDLYRLDHVSSSRNRICQRYLHRSPTSQHYVQTYLSRLHPYESGWRLGHRCICLPPIPT